MHHDSTSLNIKPFRGKSCKEHRLPHSTQSGLQKLLRSHNTAILFSSLPFSAASHINTVSSHFSATLNIHCTDSSDYPFPQTKVFWFTLPRYFSSPSQHMETGNSRSPATSLTFMDLLFLEEFINECFLVNSLQSHNTTRRVGNRVGWGSCELNHHRRLSSHKGEFFF